ncbi:GNAT family N-acetyltransferase [Agrobacterium vitis]|uniref:GNAT family N-acetyltransferase n=1 Tax=Agrobacterium vitis TaxID=373 RepID=UPI0015748B85|nr:GNAT family N-acetyltransferase [Agrobacterium vitis]NSY14876.1 GNAT family N-acetyltransferase [Agrobacterium vitis]NSY24633.1 GNAT family N-acetyltransferase [Agrobacterium vitis]WEO75261.1 GNAT family N-acetyltransferase [Agrobacterium vitis]
MNDIVVRRALRRELGNIEQIGIMAYEEFRTDVSPAVLNAYFADLRNLNYQWDHAEVLVAEIDGELGGSVMYYADASTEGLGLPSDWAGFRKLAVAPRMRGKGIGHKLVEHCVGVARENSAFTIGIHTTSFMTSARRIYSKFGFKRCPSFDRKVSDILNIDRNADDFDIIACRLELM